MLRRSRPVLGFCRIIQGKGGMSLVLGSWLVVCLEFRVL